MVMSKWKDNPRSKLSFDIIFCYTGTVGVLFLFLLALLLSKLGLPGPGATYLASVAGVLMVAILVGGALAGTYHRSIQLWKESSAHGPTATPQANGLTAQGPVRDSSLEHGLRNRFADEWIQKAAQLAESADFTVVPALLKREYQREPSYLGEDDDVARRDFESRQTDFDRIQTASNEALVRIRERTSTDQLQTLLGDGLIELRTWAANGLHDRGWRPSTVEQRVLFALVHGLAEPVGAEGLPVLLHELDAGNVKVRKAVAYSLAAIGGDAVFEPMCRLLADASTRGTAAWALKRAGHGDPRYLDPLLEAAAKEASNGDAIEKKLNLDYIIGALATMSVEAVRDRLADAANDSSVPTACDAAAAALARLSGG
ncbi:MAG: HEAT repeat domain-containing protein [Planctomycetia bacterium]|nr:HEAT repeat domain-containing protein [Planctomycetia bacterium]